MASNKTVVIACRLYVESADTFKEICRKLDEFHSDIMRKLILQWIHEQEEKGVTTEKVVNDID